MKNKSIKMIIPILITIAGVVSIVSAWAEWKKSSDEAREAAIEQASMKAESNELKADLKSTRDELKASQKKLNSFQHPLRPVEFAGGILLDYTVARDYKKIEEMARLAMKEVEKARSLGFDIQVKDDELEIRSFFSPSHDRPKAMRQTLPHLDDFQKTVIQFFPEVEVNFFNYVPTKRVAPNFGIRLKEYKTHITINLSTKTLYLEFRTTSLYDPTHNDKTINSLYDCEDGVVAIDIIPTGGFWIRNDREKKPVYRLYYFCLKVGPNKETHGYEKDALGTGVAAGADPLAIIRYTIVGRNLFTDEALRYNDQVFIDDIL